MRSALDPDRLALFCRSQPIAEREVVEDQTSLGLVLLVEGEQRSEPRQADRELHARFQLSELPQPLESVRRVATGGQQQLRRADGSAVLPDEPTKQRRVVAAALEPIEVA